MLPVIYTRETTPLVIGGGKAGLIKVDTLLKFFPTVHCLSMEFLPEVRQPGVEQFTRDFYQMTVADFATYELIYIAVPWPTAQQKQDFITSLTGDLISRRRMVCVSCRPELGNIINPCTRFNDEIMISVSTYGRSPAESVKLANRLFAEV